MKIFLSALENATASKAENSKRVAEMLVESGVEMKWNLVSYYYARGPKEKLAQYIKEHSELMLVDSGAHSFQFGIKVDWESYTREYAEFIQRFDDSSVVGYFEMDIENVIGYPAVLELREILEKVSNKIIPVWHPLRGIGDYEKMCQRYEGRVIAIGGFKGTDIKDSQYLQFIKVARKYGCKVHCLGMTRSEVLDKVPFDYTDSSSWSATARYGSIGYGKFKKGKVTKDFSKTSRGLVLVENYKQAMQMQEHYYRRWRKECND